MRIKFTLLVLIQIFILTGIVVYREYWVARGKKILLVTAPVDPRDLFRGDYVRLTYEISTLDLDKLGVTESFNPRDKIYVLLERDVEGIYHASSVSRKPIVGKTFIQGRIKYVRLNAQRLEVHVIDDSGTRHLLETGWSNFRKGDFIHFCVDARGHILSYDKEDSSYRQQCQVGRFLTGVIDTINPVRFTQLNVEYGIESYFVEEGRGREIESERDRRNLKVEVSLRKDGKGMITALVMGEKVFH